jgi:hypothetical protein
MLQQSIADLKGTPLSTQDAKGYIFDIFRRKIVPLRLFHPVVDDWAAQHPHASIGNQWILVNCFTNQIKQLTPNVAMRATIRLGKYFGLDRSPSMSQQRREPRWRGAEPFRLLPSHRRWHARKTPGTASRRLDHPKVRQILDGL